MTIPERPDDDVPPHSPSPRPEEALFEAALALPAAQRAAFLAQACAGDPTLRRKIEELLRADELAGDFLDTPAAPDVSPTSASGDITPPVCPEEQPGSRIGRYKLLQKIGEGGCGTVYQAEQQEPVVRRVALKVIKLGMDTKEVIARFEAERQALALMDHPNIAHVFDAGTTDSGRPFFVMELVQGLPITTFCDQHNLSTTARLALFTEVCHAVQHAHQKGIIHRDLKPSNILVSTSGDQPLPKVIDFGIAKATQGRLTDQTLFTAFQQFIGTPTYMSPEQAEMSGFDVDTRSDIYSLGVLLYELLTGRTPFDAKELVAAGLDEIRRRIREEEPPKPSTRLSTMEGATLSTTARLRQTEPPRLIKSVRGDLDWIVMRCLEKDRTRRYETANGLAADIARHLAHEPVLACPPSATYRLQKLMRRHRTAFAAAALITVVLILGATIATWQAVRATRAEHSARAERDRAEAGEKRAQAETVRAENLAQKEATARQNAEQLTEKIREHLYVARINAARQAWDQGDIRRVKVFLDSLRPEANQTDLRGFEWYYLWKLCHSEKLRIIGHQWTVRSIAYSPDGRTMASAGHERTIRLWNAQTGEPRGVLEGHTSWVSAVTYSSDGKILASGSADGTVRLWDAATGQPLFVFPKEAGEVTCLSFAPRGHRLAVGLGEMAPGGGTPLTSRVVSSSRGGLKILDADRQDSVIVLSGCHSGAIALAWSPDGKTLAASGASANDGVAVWDAASARRIAALPRFHGPVFGLAFSPGGEVLATGCWYPWDREAELALWHTRDRFAKPESKRRLPPFTCLAFAPDGLILATGGKDEIVHLWDVAGGSEEASFKGQGMEIFALAFSPDGKNLASGCYNGRIHVWERNQVQAHDVLSNAGCFRIAITGDSTRVACPLRDVVQIWSTPDARRLYNLQLTARGSDMELAISDDCRTLAVVSSTGLMHVFDLERRALRYFVNTHKEKVLCVAVSPDGNMIATGGYDRTVKLWDGAHGAEQATLSGHTDRVSAAVFTPDGKTLISGGDEIKFWDIASRQLIRRLSVSASRLIISRDGKLLAARTTSQVVRFIDVATGRDVGGVYGHLSAIATIAFSIDQKTLATASTDGTAALWRVPSGELLFKVPSNLGTTWSAAFSADSRTLAIGSGSLGAKQPPQVVLLRAATPAEADQPERSVPMVKSSKHGQTVRADEPEKPDPEAKEPDRTSESEPPHQAAEREDPAPAPTKTRPAGTSSIFQPVPAAPSRSPTGSTGSSQTPRSPLKPSEVIAAATRAIEKNPRLASAYVSRGYHRQNSGDLAGALADLNQAIALAPTMAGAYSNRGINWMAQGDFSAAIADFDQAIARDKDRSAYPYLYRHLCLRRLRPAEPSTSFAATMAAWEDGWPKSIGRYLVGALTEEQFLTLASRGGDRTPQPLLGEAHYYVGMAHVLRGEPAVAREFFEKCIALSETPRTAALLARSELARLSTHP